MTVTKTFCLLSVFWCVELSIAQEPSADPPTPQPFIAQIAGTWQLMGFHVHGQTHETENFGPTVFEKNKWTMQTRNGDHVFELKNVNINADPIEVTCVDQAGKRSFVALARIDKNRLTIARGLHWKRDANGFAAIPPPTSLEPRQDTLVYTFARSTPSITERPTLKVQLVDESKTNPETLFDGTLKTRFGGEFRYPAPVRNVRQQKEEHLPGTLVRGRIQQKADATHVSITIQITAAVASDTPTTEVLRTESYEIKTTLTDDAADESIADRTFGAI